ncbi:MAG: hypothetical protein HYV97_06140 [Bdellovibrio sp.]|nr:hypothetical protein [Bdellovibrio sp.]
MALEDSISFLPQLPSFVKASDDLFDNEKGIRDIFSAERFIELAGQLAVESNTVSTEKTEIDLLSEVTDASNDILKSYLYLTKLKDRHGLPPASEWFLDNFFIVEDQFRSIKRDLPKDYYLELPKNILGKYTGYPRVYAIAHSIVGHSDSQLSLETIAKFIITFQSYTPLNIGELWAIFITFRIALINRLQPLVNRIIHSLQKREDADHFADELLEYAIDPQTLPQDLVQMLANYLKTSGKLSCAFIVQLIQRLRDQDQSLFAVLDWLEKTLNSCNSCTTDVIKFEHFRQAADQVTIGNIITSMRFLSSIDWHTFLEEVNLVDPILNNDPIGAYVKMNQQTRDSYRKAIERVAKRSKGSEIEIAKMVVEFATREGAQATSEIRKKHIGYYLLDEGVFQLEKYFHYRPRFRERVSRFIDRHPLFIYFGLFTTLIIVFLGIITKYFFVYDQSILFGIGLLFIILNPVSEFSLGILNYSISLLRQPRHLPRMETKFGISADDKTMVVIPCLLSNEAVIKELTSNLEIHYLANQDQYIYFSLLADLQDADSATTPEDMALLNVASREIERLNLRYSTGEFRRFYFFHRSRLFNSSEEKWMGWERKRGKIFEFNRLLRGDKSTSFLAHTVADEFLSQIKYVITLDADTQLPLHSARRLIGAITHPLNAPVFNPTERRIEFGYGIIQPRITISAIAATRTRFAHIFSGNTGLDPYTTGVSDVYQDLFKEGTYIGKGLYAVDAFQEAVGDKVPENTVLSHDLFEGCFARVGLETSIELIDDYPADFETFANRLHRWTRGDWQIARWLFQRVPDRSRKLVRNYLPFISRWKIFDNLRRSLLTPAFLSCFLLSWTFLPGSALAWTAVFLAILCFPIYMPFIEDVSKHHESPLWEHLENCIRSSKIRLEQNFLLLVFMPSLAASQLDAILRTLYRMLISKKKLLQWVTFSQVQRQSAKGVRARNLLLEGPVFSLATAGLLVWVNPSAIPVALPFLVIWLSVPLISSWTKQALTKKVKPLKSMEIESYRRYARITWHFFETFLDAKDHWLAPDNYQEDPKPVIAHKTSPTNIGLQLLATQSAYDLGYIGLTELVEQLDRIFTVLGKLETMNGHFYNWYDTLTLRPLHPLYISSVDSGNLAGHLLCLKQACLELAQGPFFNLNARQGLQDGLRILIENIKRLQKIPDLPRSGSMKRLLHALIDILNRVEKESWQVLLSELGQTTNLLNDLIVEGTEEISPNIQRWMNSVIHQIQSYQKDENADVHALRAKIENIASLCEVLAARMDFRFLYDDTRKILSIGFNVRERRIDNSYYDLLASESRLTSFFSILKGDIPVEHWFRLGRQLTKVTGRKALVSWSATMFEYLMPLLVMRTYKDTLLDITYEAIIHRQIEYAKQRQVPWGVSEAGYNARDLHFNYQYGAFGIPGLGLKRGLRDDLVISPYSTMLASMILPSEALANLTMMEKLEVLGKYGFYESIDYTLERVPQKQKFAVLRSYMAHHQGMSLVALNNLLNGLTMQRRFHADPRVQANELLLQERIPTEIHIIKPRAEETHWEALPQPSEIYHTRVYTDVPLPSPRTQIISNGTYSVMVTSAGSGFSKCEDVMITRWREDPTQDHWGQFFYIQNFTDSGIWSSGIHPMLSKADKYQATFAEDKIEIARKDRHISTQTEIIVSSEDNVELRRISLSNESDIAMEIEVTSFMEIVLARANDDNAHQTFSNLFIQTEFCPEVKALLAHRRKRSQSDRDIWGFHILTSEGEGIGPIQYETDRSRFIGRGRSAAMPIVLSNEIPLSNTTGPVLDPIFSLRQRVRIPPHDIAKLTFITGVSRSREEVRRLSEQYHTKNIFQRETHLGWIKSQVGLHHLNISMKKAHIYQLLGNRIIYLSPDMRVTSQNLIVSNKKQSALWPYGISGDHPIILTQINEQKDMVMIRDLLHAHEYLRLKGVKIDLVIINAHATSYLQSLHDELTRQILISGNHALIDKPGGIFIRRADLIPEEDRSLLKCVARAIIYPSKGSLEAQLHRRILEMEPPARFVATSQRRDYPRIPIHVPELVFFNTIGGFTPDGREYVISLKEDQWTPAPWVNIIGNRNDFGFMITENGQGHIWSINSRENKISPWSNDPVSDSASEAIYVRDEESGTFWTPTPLPIRGPEHYLIRHGQGYSQFEHNTQGIAHIMTVFAPVDESVKIIRLRLKNLSKAIRKLSVTSYVEWVLGVSHAQSAPMVFTEWDNESQGILAQNSYNNEFANRISFMSTSESEKTYTCDRKEFIGRNGSLAKPAGLGRIGLGQKSGGRLDPCAAIQSYFELAPNKEREIIILIGQSESKDEARKLISKYKNHKDVHESFVGMQNFWNQTLEAIEIKTPDPSMDLLVNRWLIYQTLSCRVWARSAFYQVGGAFGFRDQLQDVMALVYSHPQIIRSHILLTASRQFPEGDVQHWWHPPTGRGVRTRCSDDLLWLPYVLSFYLKVTGDESILFEIVSYIDAPQLMPEQHDIYLEPKPSSEKSNLFAHCLRAIDRSLTLGEHGLPLIGSGDWNDAMNLVGDKGKGESVWMAWFLAATLKAFIPLCEKLNEHYHTARYQEYLQKLKESIEANAWDGEWYLRAFFDNGEKLGSQSCEECKIDSISQTWAILSGMGDKTRAHTALQSVSKHLINKQDRIIKLIAPPFDQGTTDPGYIKGYLPGIRENGGQYTHAAIWTIMAYAALKNAETATELYSLINPINHTSSYTDQQKYKIEPYVIAADIYGVPPHVGRGGWSWYTGSASWMYRAAIESILGFDLKQDKLTINPCIPKEWNEYKITYRRGKTQFNILVLNNQESAVIEFDGKLLEKQDINITDDGKIHHILVRLGPSSEN